MTLRIVKPFRMLSIVALASLLTLSNFAFANLIDDAQIQLQAIESGKKAIVKVWNLPESQSASLKVLNAEGELVYKESFKNDAYAKMFDFSELPAGKYKVLLQSGTSVQSENFEILKDGNINVAAQNHAVQEFKPFVKVRGNKVDLLIENRFDQNMDITIKNSKGEVAYQKQLAPHADYANRLNLSYLPKDSYMIRVAGDGFEYTQEIDLD